MPKFLKDRRWIISAGAAAAGVYGIPYPVECLLETDGNEPGACSVDWDAELRTLTDH